MEWFKQKYRKLHLDFHTGECVTDLLSQFDAKSMIAEFKKTHAEVIVAFAKDHHGHAYYPTDIGYRHPSLTVDMLGELTSEAKKEGIKVIAYFSIGWDNWAAGEHPDWRTVSEDGAYIESPMQKIAGFKIAYKGRWQNVCMNSPYAEYTLGQMEEVLKQYPVDGIWMDILGYADNACYCEYCRKGFADYLKETNIPYDLDPNTVQKIAFMRWKEMFRKRFTGRVRELTSRYRPDAVVMDYDFLIDEAHHPAYSFQSYISRYGVAAAPTGVFEVVTPRFFNVWGEWTLKPSVLLKQELITIAANGAMPSLGDQIYPNGTLDKGVYNTFSDVFSWLEKREKWLYGYKSAADVAILDKPDVRQIYLSMGEDPLDEQLGIMRILSEDQRPADIILNLDSDLSRYGVLIAPDQAFLSKDEIEKLEAYVRSGGMLVGTGRTSLFDERFKQLDNFALADLFGIDLLGASPYSINYFDAGVDISDGIPETPVLIRDRVNLLGVREGTKSFATVNFPSIETTDEVFISHQHAPPAQKTTHPFISVRRLGKGVAILFACGIGRQYWLTGSPWIRKAFLNTLNNADMDNRRIKIKTQAPVEVTVMEDEKYLIIHLINFHSDRPFCKMWNPSMRAPIIDDMPAVSDIGIEVKGEYGRIFEAPSDLALENNCSDGITRFKLPSLHIHSAVVLEKLSH